MIRELRRLREIVEERSPIVADHLAYQLNRPRTS
jgi:hypothetical protein